MNKKHYNNVIDWTLKHDQAAQTEDSLATARAIFKNMGVALPNGSMQEVYDTIKTNKYMGWRSCTMQQAQQAADKGTAAIGISKDRMVILSATDEEEPVAETASVMTLSESTSAYAVAGLEYYSYSCGATTLPEEELTEEQKHFVSVIAGEAIGANTLTQKAVAHTIMNRLLEPRDVWSDVASVSDVLVESQYNAVGGSQYNQCMAYLNNRDYSSELYEGLISAVIPIYLGCEADFTGGHIISLIFMEALVCWRISKLSQTDIKSVVRLKESVTPNIECTAVCINIIN